jgi:endonuclease-3
MSPARPRKKRRGPSPQKLAADRRKRRALAETVLERLGERYDHPMWDGPRVDTIDELILTILSQNTADTNSFRAFTALRARYASWDEVLAAPTDELAMVLKPGGLAPTKSRRIQHVLAEVHSATNGSWDLAFLGAWPLEQARAWLTSLPGIGRKTAAIILLFNFGRAAMPVDTHVHRVTRRLGIVPDKVSAERADRILHDLVPDGLRTPLHVAFIRLGREICKAPIPRCAQCPLKDLCPTAPRYLSAGRTR